MYTTKDILEALEKALGPINDEDESVTAEYDRYIRDETLRQLHLINLRKGMTE